LTKTTANYCMCQFGISLSKSTTCAWNQQITLFEPGSTVTCNPDPCTTGTKYCGLHGSCDSSSGKAICRCDACASLDSTGACTVNTCQSNSQCSSSVYNPNAQCNCNTCYTMNLGSCTLCSGQGTCQAGSCVCSNGYSGPNCSVAPDPCYQKTCSYGTCSNGICPTPPSDDSGRDTTTIAIVCGVLGAVIALAIGAFICGRYNRQVKAKPPSDPAMSTPGAAYVRLDK
jgi:hypothetical protein